MIGILKAHTKKPLSGEEIKKKISTISTTKAKFLQLVHNEAFCRDRASFISSHIQKLRELTELDRQRGYDGERRGWEVCLPNPALWPEIVSKNTLKRRIVNTRENELWRYGEDHSHLESQVGEYL